MDLLYAGDCYIKTNGPTGAVSWVLRYITITPHSLDWFTDPGRVSHIGAVELAGGSLMLASDDSDAPSSSDGVCVELDWEDGNFLPLFFSTVDDSHDAVLVRFLTFFRSGGRLPKPNHLPCMASLTAPLWQSAAHCLG